MREKESIWASYFTTIYLVTQSETSNYCQSNPETNLIIPLKEIIQLLPLDFKIVIFLFQHTGT